MEKVKKQNIPSSRTHHILQPSATLNRRYVRRPINHLATPASSSINQYKDASADNHTTPPSAKNTTRTRSLSDNRVNITFEHKTSSIKSLPQTSSHILKRVPLPFPSSPLPKKILVNNTEKSVEHERRSSFINSPAPITTPTSNQIPITRTRIAKNPYVSSIASRKTATKIIENSHSFSPIFDQQPKLDQALNSFKQSADTKQNLRTSSQHTSQYSPLPPSSSLSLTTKVQAPIYTTSHKQTSSFFTNVKKKATIASILNKKITRNSTPVSPTIPATNMSLKSVETAFFEPKISSKTPKTRPTPIRKPLAQNKLIKTNKQKEPLPPETPSSNLKKAYQHTTKHTLPKKRNRLVLAFFCSATCVAMLFFIVQANMPDISIRVAAMQTGIQASYPSYIPRDYKLAGVHTNQDNSVAISFVGMNDEKFVLTEEKLPWDSTTLLNRFVKTKWNDDYDTIREQGITIYTNGSNAAWVNAGIVYKITSIQGSLTKKQIKNIVTSL